MDIREQLSKIRCFLLDMDGTFYLGNQLIDGSLDFLDALKRTGRQCLFLTNNSSKSASFYKEKLKKMGVPEEFRSVAHQRPGHGPVCDEPFSREKGFLLANASKRRNESPERGNRSGTPGLCAHRL
jgi:hydroxymethylpyrimidine pyrophosphatase-like HAD family hydrolase